MSQGPHLPDPPLDPDDDALLTQATRPMPPPKLQPDAPQPLPPQPQPAPVPQNPYSQQPYATEAAPPQLYPPPSDPQQLETLNYVTPGAPAGGIWTYGGVLVMHKQAQLPPQCIKCCAPADGRPLKRKLTWHPGWLYVLILFPGILIYAIVALVIQERATIYVSLCEKHRARRRMHLWIAWGIFIASLACFFMAASARGRDEPVYWSIAGIFGIVAALIYSVFNSRVVAPDKIDQQYVWLKGICPQFLSQFPSMLPQQQY